MTIRTAEGWLLDVLHHPNTDDIVLLIKLQSGKVIQFKKRLQEYHLYILPKSEQAGQDLFQQLSRCDHLIKRIFWNEKYIDLQDKTKTGLIGISLEYYDRQDFKVLIQKLGQDSRVKSLYNIDISDIMQFIYTQLKIPPTSKVEIKFDDDTELLLSITRVDDSNEIAPPPFSTMYVELLNEFINDKNDPLKVSMRTDAQTETIVFNGLSDPAFTSHITQQNPDIVIFCGDHDKLSFSNDKPFEEWSKQKVIIFTNSTTIHDIHLSQLIEKSRFSYLPLRFVSRYGMMRMIDSRITFELLQREFVIPARLSTVSKHHEDIRTLDDVVANDKAGLIISPEIGLHENVAVLDFNDEYANLILRHNISYETLVDHSNRDSELESRPTENQVSPLLPSIMGEIVARRVYLKKRLREELEPNTLLYNYCEECSETLKQILVCLYGTSGSIWNRYSNVYVFEEINKLSRQMLLKTKDIVQAAGFDVIYADTDAVFLKRKNATRSDYEKVMNELIRETGLDMTLEYHYKFLVLLYVEADEKLEARKHYYGLTYNSQLIARGIDTRRHDSPTFIKEFQMTLLLKLFDCKSSGDVLTTGYGNALLYITQSIDKIMNGEVPITDLVISKLLRQNIEKYTSLFPHVAAAIKLNLSGLVTNRGDNIQYIYTNSNHIDPLQRIAPAKLMSSEVYDKQKYLEMLLDSAEAVLAVFGFSRLVFGFDRKKSYHWWDELYQQRERDIESAKMEL